MDEPGVVSDASSTTETKPQSLSEPSTPLLDPDLLRFDRRTEHLWMVDSSRSQEEIEALIEESDRMQEALADAGVTDADLILRHEISEAEVTDAEMLEYYERHRERFGDRTFEESRSAVEEIVRLRKVRQKYGGEPASSISAGTVPGSGEEERGGPR